MLGLVRNNRRLPRDSDSGLGVWKVDVSISDIIWISRQNEFQYVDVLGDINSVRYEVIS